MGKGLSIRHAINKKTTGMKKQDSWSLRIHHIIEKSDFEEIHIISRVSLWDKHFNKTRRKGVFLNDKY